MAQNILSIPAGGTIKIINEYMIHSYPHPRPYKLDSYVTFRPKGSVMDRIYSVQKEVVLVPNSDDIEESIKHLQEDEKQRIKAYIRNRKLGFGFEKPNHPYMFWILKLEMTLDHNPRPVKGYASHVYFSYDELTSGKQYVTISSSKKE
jgi:hypothetical protein